MRTIFHLTIVFLFSVALFGQRVTSDILGAIRDQSGAIVPSVKIVVTHVATGQQRETISDASGNYHVAGLPPGAYEIRTGREGFQTVVLKDIELLVNQQAVLDVTLQVGQLQQQVEVTARASILESTTSHLSGIVTQSTLRELPLNGRDLFYLTILEPGVVPSTNGGPNPWAEGPLHKAAIQGSRPTMNNVTLDGGDMNDPAFNIPTGGVGGAQMGVEAIQEFRVLLNAYSAEFGRNAGGNIQYVTKAGTNDWHGALLEFHRNAALDARNFFDEGKIPPFVRNQFGFDLGGPIRKNKTFLFTDYEGLREHKSVTASLSVPDENVRRGFLPSANDPNTLVNVGVDPRVVPFLALYPLPNAGSLGNGFGKLQTFGKQITRADYGLVRVDHAFDSGDRFFGRYAIDDSGAIVPFISTSVPGFPGERITRNQYAMISWTRTIGRSLNEAKFHVNRTRYLTHVKNSSPLSISLVPGRALGTISIAGLPSVGNNLAYPIGSASNTFELIDNFMVERGRHLLKIGGDAKRFHLNGNFDVFANGTYSFSDLTAFGLPAASNNPPLEFFLHAIPFVYIGVDPKLADSDRGFRQNYLGLYAQDDWHVRDRLTLNLGLRWEDWTTPTEVNGRIANIRNVATDLKPTVGKLWDRTPMDLFSPRLGFAWTPSKDGKTVIRGAAGLMRDQIWGNLYTNVRFYEPFYRPLLYILPQFASPISGVNSITGLGGPPSAIGVFGITSHPDFPYYLQYNLNIQREVSRDLVVTATYAGSRGTHLVRTGEANPFVPSRGSRLNPNLGSVPLVVTDVQSYYNSGQISITKRLDRGLSFQGAYTFSKSVDDGSGPFPSDFVSESGITQDFFNRKGDRGRSAFDRRHVFIANFLYELPFRSQSRALQGWGIGGIVSLMSGAPFTANLGPFNNSGTQASFTADRPNIKANIAPCSRIIGRPDKWFDASMFSLPLPGTYGNSGRNTLCGPDLRNVDFSLTKLTSLNERTKLQFRAEFFNIFNRANFDVPVNTQTAAGNGGNGDAIFIGRRGGSCRPESDDAGCGVLAPNVGNIFRTVTTSRQIQFGLKLIF